MHPSRHQCVSLALAAFAVLSACVDAADDTTDEISSEPAALASRPFGFARISNRGSVVTSFNGSGGGVTAVRTSAGHYQVHFEGLGTTDTSAGARGNVQVTAEGMSEIMCVLDGWDAMKTVVAYVTCYIPNRPFAEDWVAADSAFAVLYTRDTMPTTPTGRPTRLAYIRMQADGAIVTAENYNSSGVPNTVGAAGLVFGRYEIRIPGAIFANASLMLTPMRDGKGVAGTCRISDMRAEVVEVDCTEARGTPGRYGFTLLYATSGPPTDQQGAHAIYQNRILDPARTGALGRYSWCSPATVSATRSGQQVEVTVAGDLGSHDDAPFVRASFAAAVANTKRYEGVPTAQHCKVEQLTTSGTAPSSTATTTVQCYGHLHSWDWDSPYYRMNRAEPAFSLVHVTSEGIGPC